MDFTVTALQKNESERQAVEARTVIERCRREIAEIEALILTGHPDVQGLCQALADWSEELRLLEGGLRR